MNAFNKIITVGSFLLGHSLALAFALPPLDTLEQKLSFLLQIKEIIPNLFSDAVTYDTDLFTLLENEQELLALLKKHPQFDELFKKKLYYKLQITPPKEGILMEEITIKAEAVEQWKQELFTNFEHYSHEYSSPDIFLKSLKNLAISTDFSLDPLTVINNIGRFKKDKSCKSNIKTFKHANDIIQQCKKEHTITDKFQCIKDNYSKISAPINQVSLPGLPLEEEIIFIIKNLIDREKLQRMLLLGATMYSAPNREWANSNWQEVQDYLNLLPSETLIYLNDKNDALLPLLCKILNASSEDKKARVLLEPIHKKIHFYASQTDNKQKLITKGIMLEQVPPEVGIFRGTVGGDCSSQLSFPYPNYPDEMVFFIYGPDQKNKAIKGYVTATLVELENGEKALYVITIAGKRVSSSDTKIIFMGLEQAKKQLGVNHIALPIKENIDSLINYSAIKNIYLSQVEKSKKTNINYLHPEIRSIIENYSPKSEYNNGSYDYSSYNENAEIINYAINPIKVNVEFFSHNQIKQIDLSNFKFSKIFEFIKDLRISSTKNFNQVITILEEKNTLKKGIIDNLFDVIDNSNVSAKLSVQTYKSLINNEFLKLSVDASFLDENPELLFPGIFNCSDWSSDENIIEAARLAIKIINNDNYEDKEKHFDQNIISSLYKVDIFNKLSVKYINNLKIKDKRKKALSVLTKFFYNMTEVHYAIADLLNDADARTRKKALFSLGRLTGVEEKAIHVSIAHFLKDPDLSIRRQALLLLAYVKDPLIYRALEGCLSDPDPTMQKEALLTLIRFDNTNAALHLPLARLLNDADLRVVKKALWQLFEIKSSNPDINYVIARLLNHENTEISHLAFCALSAVKHSDEELVNYLFTLLKDENSDTRFRALQLLVKSEIESPKIIESALEFLNSPLHEVRCKVLDVFDKVSSIGSDTFLAIANLLGKINDIGHVFPLLKKHYKEHVEIVINIINNPFYAAKEKFISIFKYEFNLNKNILTALSQLLKIDDEGIRLKVLAILNQNNGIYSDCIDDFSSCLSDQNFEIRSMASALVAKIKPDITPEVMHPQEINQLLMSKDKNIIKKGLKELKLIKHKEPETLLLLVELLRDKDSIVCNLALEVLKASIIDNQEIIQALIDLLVDPLTQKMALSILGENVIRDPEHHLIIASFFSHEDNDIYLKALCIIMNNEIESEKIINDIVELLKHENIFRRRWAVQALGNLKPSDPEIHLSMARLLLSSRQIRPVILRALAKVKVQNPKVHELIRKLSQDTNKEVKEAALAALASLGIPN